LTLFTAKNRGIATGKNQKNTYLTRFAFNTPKWYNINEIKDMYKTIPIKGIIILVARNAFTTPRNAFLTPLEDDTNIENTIKIMMIAISPVSRELTKEFSNCINEFITILYLH